MRVSARRELTRTGELVRLDSPRVTVERRLLVVRDDGCVFGEGGDRCDFFGAVSAWRRAFRIYDAIVHARKSAGAADPEV